MNRIKKGECTCLDTFSPYQRGFLEHKQDRKALCRRVDSRRVYYIKVYFSDFKQKYCSTSTDRTT